MIEVKNLVKHFGDFCAVDNLSFSVPKGQVLGFLGPNGAGKSTTMRVITGAISPSSGSVSIGGIDVIKRSIDAQKLLGYLPENAPSYAEMSVREFLEFIGDVRGLTGKSKAMALDRVKEQCFLGEMWNVLIETLSKGYRQRVGFAQAVLHDPPALILDEPTDGLDPNQKHEIRRFIRTLGQEKTIILSTHILEEVEALCSRVIIISNGKLMADKTPQELARMSEDFNAVTIELSKAISKETAEKLKSLGKYQKLELIDTLNEDGTPEHTTLKVWPRDQQNIVQAALADVKEIGFDVKTIHVSGGRLDEVFRDITEGH